MGTSQTDRHRQTDREREILSRQQRPPTSAKKKPHRRAFHCGTENAAQEKKNYERARRETMSVLSVVQCKMHLAEREPGTWPIGIDESSRLARHTHARAYTDRLDTAKSWAFWGEWAEESDLASK